MEYGARLIRTAAGIGDVRFDAFELKPAYESQGREFARALDRVWIDGRWAVYLDELSYLEADLGLTPWIKRLLTQGRSKRITVACGMQRPVQVTRYALSSCTHLLCFGQEGRDAKTIGEVGAPYLRDVVQELDKFQFVWFNRRERTYMIGRLDLAADAIVDVEGADDAERTDGAEARTAAGG